MWVSVLSGVVIESGDLTSAATQITVRDNPASEASVGMRSNECFMSFSREV